MGQTQIFRGVQTCVVKDELHIAGFYRGTKVAEVTNVFGIRRVTLNTGGWKSVTTKTRMNQFSAEFCNNAFSVYQKKGQWFVNTKLYTERGLEFNDDVIAFDI